MTNFFLSDIQEALSDILELGGTLNELEQSDEQPANTYRYTITSIKQLGGCLLYVVGEVRYKLDDNCVSADLSNRLCTAINKSHNYPINLGADITLQPELQTLTFDVIINCEGLTIDSQINNVNITIN